MSLWRCRGLREFLLFALEWLMWCGPVVVVRVSGIIIDLSILHRGFIYGLSTYGNRYYVRNSTKTPMRLRRIRGLRRILPII